MKQSVWKIWNIIIFDDFYSIWCKKLAFCWVFDIKTITLQSNGLYVYVMRIVLTFLLYIVFSYNDQKPLATQFKLKWEWNKKISSVLNKVTLGSNEQPLLSEYVGFNAQGKWKGLFADVYPDIFTEKPHVLMPFVEAKRGLLNSKSSLLTPASWYW